MRGADSPPDEAPRRPYRGRFAPTPSGPLHFGSLVAAVGSCLDARAHGGEWWVRIEDLDPPRVLRGAADDILATLERFGFEWDGPVVFQSTRTEAYAAAVEHLRTLGRLRECRCSRSMLAALPENRSRSGDSADELYHPADCLTPTAAGPAGHALRLRVADATAVTFEDRSLGSRSYDVAATVGDFVLQRRDGLHAYQLAVVVDDAAQGMTDVVRGCDLLTSTARQMLLQRALGLETPSYLHLPLAVDDRGLKLSKSEQAPATGHRAPVEQLIEALRFLGQTPPGGLERATLAEAWEWGRTHWRVAGFAGRERGTVTWLGGNAGDAG